MTSVRITLSLGLRLLRSRMVAATTASGATAGPVNLASSLTRMPTASSSFLPFRSSSTNTPAPASCKSLALSPGAALPTAGASDTPLSTALTHIVKDVEARPQRTPGLFARQTRCFALKVYVSTGHSKEGYRSANKAPVMLEVQDARPGGQVRTWVLNPGPGTHWAGPIHERGVHEKLVERDGVVTSVMTGVTREEAEETGLPISKALRQLMSHVSDTMAPGEQPVFLVWGPFCMTQLAQAVSKEGAAAVEALQAMADIPYVNMETWWSEAQPAKHPSIGMSPRQVGGIVDWITYLHEAHITGERTKGAHRRPEIIEPTAAHVAKVFRQAAQFQQENPDHCRRAKGNPQPLGILLQKRTGATTNGSSSRRRSRRRRSSQ